MNLDNSRIEFITKRNEVLTFPCIVFDLEEQTNSSYENIEASYASKYLNIKAPSIKSRSYNLKVYGSDCINKFIEHLSSIIKIVLPITYFNGSDSYEYRFYFDCIINITGSSLVNEYGTSDSGVIGNNSYINLEVVQNGSWIYLDGKQKIIEIENNVLTERLVENENKMMTEIRKVGKIFNISGHQEPYFIFECSNVKTIEIIYQDIRCEYEIQIQDKGVFHIGMYDELLNMKFIKPDNTYENNFFNTRNSTPHFSVHGDNQQISIAFNNDAEVDQVTYNPRFCFFRYPTLDKLLNDKQIFSRLKNAR